MGCTCLGCLVYIEGVHTPLDVRANSSCNTGTDGPGPDSCFPRLQYTALPNQRSSILAVPPARVAQTWQTSGQIRRCSSQCWSVQGKLWWFPGQVCSMVAELGPILIDSDMLVVYGTSCSMLAELVPNLVEFASQVADVCPRLVHSMLILAGLGNVGPHQFGKFGRCRSECRRTRLNSAQHRQTTQQL